MGKAPYCEIITIGTELLMGQIEDTNTSFLAREMAGIGVAIRYRTAVGDRLEEIEKALNLALERSDFIICTGGLGPTLDDLTRDAVAGVAGVQLEFRPELMAQIENMFMKAGYRMPENNRRQAFVPAGSRIIPNPVGTAPAFIAFSRGKAIICLPGVPREMKYLLREVVKPWIIEYFALGSQAIACRVIKVVGLGESRVDSLIGDLIRPDPRYEIGLLASIGEISIRITAFAEKKSDAAEIIVPLETEIRKRLGKAVVGADDDTLESVIEGMIRSSGESLAILETFSAGIAAQRLYRLSSEALIESHVMPKRESLKELLGKHPDCEEDAVRAAEIIRKRAGAGVGLAIVGFARPCEAGHEVHGFCGASGEGISKGFSWHMAGEMAMLQQRGGVIGLNTLRLALFEKGPTVPGSGRER